MNDRIVDVIREGEIIRMLESRALEEDLFILRRVLEDEGEIAPIQNMNKKQNTSNNSQPRSILENWKAAKITPPTKSIINSLKPNFHWIIIKERRTKNISRAQLSASAGITEAQLKEVEIGRLPSEDYIIISKLENALGISLRKEDNFSEQTLAILQKNQNKQEIGKQNDKKIPEIRNSPISGNEIEIID